MRDTIVSFYTILHTNIKIFFNLESSTLSTQHLLRLKLETNQTEMQAVHKIQDIDIKLNFEAAFSVKSYDTKNSDEHRKEQFANLQHFYDNKLPLYNFQWQVKNILKKYIYEGELYYLVRFLNTNMNATKHNYEYPLE